MTKKGHCYTPKETVQFENLVKTCFMQAKGEMINGPARLLISAEFMRPKSHYGTGKRTTVLKDDAPFHHIGKPDSDNIIKAIADSLNKLAYPDDSCVAEVSCVKLYTDKTECCVVIVEAIK
jgi:Holliday junction resolvase RusA-like endonuclease